MIRRAGQPESQILQRIALVLDRFTDAQEAWCSQFARSRIVHGSVLSEINDLLALPFVLVGGDFSIVLDNFVVDAGEDARPVVVVVLRPSVRGMIVALGALNARSQENLGGCFRPRGGVTIWSIVIRRWGRIGTAS